jgi:hypothetical protein
MLQFELGEMEVEDESSVRFGSKLKTSAILFARR